MTHFLRNNRNHTIVDIEASENDIQSVVIIDHYSLFLLALDDERRDEFMADMGRMQEIRGEFFETNHGMTPDEMARSLCKEMTEKWELYYTTD